MEKLKLSTLKGYLGIIVFILAIGIIYYWENYGREAFIYANVPIFKEDVKEGTIINPEMLTHIKIEQSKLISNVVTDTTKIVGLETKNFIARNAQLHEKYFEAPNIVLEDEEFIFSLPKEWILACPLSIRRKDAAFFYAVKSDKVRNSGNSADPNVSPNGPPSGITDTSKVAKDILSGLNVPITKAVVAYVKDQTNREVVSVNTDNRFDGSSAISSIEIVASMGILKELQSSYESGHQFVIMYQ